jgi:hypothetical protein
MEGSDREVIRDICLEELKIAAKILREHSQYPNRVLNQGFIECEDGGLLSLPLERAKTFYPLQRAATVRRTNNYSFIHQWRYSPWLGPDQFFSFVIFFTQKVGLLGRGISPSQGRYLRTGQHKHRINAQKNIHALSGIRTHDPTV